MPLSAGTRIGCYDVTALLGEGGMGQVWQATDTQLNREVALKILPDAFATDPDRLARFTREAQNLARASRNPRAQGRWCWSWLKDRLSLTGSRRDRSRLMRRCRLPSRSRKRSKRPMSRVSSTAT